ncbi:MAG: hypothetical protein GVY30_12580 [Chloroflexi bacterium]|nr:hypothetical protein [Chloroflexota bacterium]
MAVRKVSNRGGNIVGHFPSLKLGRMVAFESLIERDFVYLLDYEPTVERFAEQPLTIQYQHAGKQRRYTPDFHVIYRGHPFLFECKPAQRVAEPENQLKFAAARQWCQPQGWAFGIVTDEYLARNWRITNIKVLTQFARYAIPPETKSRIFAALVAAPGPVTVSDVVHQVQPQDPQSLMIPILHMAYHHEVALPLNEGPITGASQLTLTALGSENGGWWP